MKKENRTDNINMKVKPSIKNIAREMAKKQNTTMSNYISNLILKDAQNERTKTTKFIVEKVGIGDLPSSTEIFDKQDEANSRAVGIWKNLTNAEKRKYHVYVTDVTEEDIDPNAILRYKKEGGEFPWADYLYSGHTDGNFNSYDTDVDVKIIGTSIEYKVRGKKISVDISKRLRQMETEKTHGTFDVVQFTAKCIEDDISKIEKEIGDELFFNERDRIYSALANYYE